MDGQSLTDNLLVTSVTEAEIRTGIAILPEGERQRGLAAAAERLSACFSLNVSCHLTVMLPRLMQCWLLSAGLPDDP